MNREEKINDIKKMIDELFGDMAVTRTETKIDLMDISEYVNTMIDTLEAEDQD